MASISNQPYKNDAHIDAIVKTLRDGGHLLCSNLAASSKAFVVEETFRQMGGQHLIVCADKEDAAFYRRGIFEAQYGQYSNRCVAVVTNGSVSYL